MYGGEVVPVTMVFLFKMMGAVMDKFRHDIMIMKEDEKHFRITVPVAVSQQFSVGFSALEKWQESSRPKM